MSQSTVTLNFPIEVSAGEYSTITTIQGEQVYYTGVHIPLLYQTKSSDPTSSTMSKVFQWREDSTNQTQVVVDVNTSTIGYYSTGTAVLKSLFSTALAAADLTNVGMQTGALYYNNVARNTATDPVKYYVDRDTHVAGDVSGAALSAYLKEYIYENVNALLGTAATTGDVDVILTRNGVTAGEYIAETVANQIAGVGNTEQNITGAAIRQNIYEQMYSAAPERFNGVSSQGEYHDLPFYTGDSVSFLTTFDFPASQINLPVVENALRTGNSSVYIATGNKINVISSTKKAPVVANYSSCTVMLRVEITDTA